MPSDLGVSTALGWHGDNPKKLPLINIDPTRVQEQTISGNIKNAPAAFDLAQMVNKFSSEQMLAMLERMLPGYGQLRDKGTEVIGSFMRGEVPKDVERLLQQRAAEKGITLGTSGSGFQQFDTLRNLGLTSLDLTQKGLNSAAQWIASIPKSPQFDFTSMFFSPQQRLDHQFRQAMANTQLQSFNNWVDSLPSNLERGLATAMDYSINVGTSVGESFLGAYTGNPNLSQDIGQHNTSSPSESSYGGGGGSGMSGLQGQEASGGFGGFGGFM